MARARNSITIRDVARDAGVSLQTVSRVVNGGHNVRPQLRDKVRAAIERLGYVPSLAARRMSGSRSYIILVVMDREGTLADWREQRGTDRIDQILLGGMIACAPHGCRLMLELVDTHPDQAERELAAALSALQPDGVILPPPHADHPVMTRLLAERAVPFARIGTDTPGPGIALTMGDQSAAQHAASRLIALGHRRIAMIAGPPDCRLSTERIIGWRRALDAARLRHDGLLEAGDCSYESGTRAARALLTRDPGCTAIIAGNDRMALAALDVARDRGLRVPQDLSLIAFDDTPIVRFAQPPLTAIAPPLAQTIARAAEWLIARSEASDTGDDGAVINVAAALVERSSIARARLVRSP